MLSAAPASAACSGRSLHLITSQSLLTGEHTERGRGRLSIHWSGGFTRENERGGRTILRAGGRAHGEWRGGPAILRADRRAHGEWRGGPAIVEAEGITQGDGRIMAHTSQHSLRPPLYTKRAN